MTPTPNITDFLSSDHISERTRAILQQRATPVPEDYAPGQLSPESFRILRSVTNDLLPQETVLGTQALDLAARIDMSLAGKRDGWRYAELPSDIQAWEAGLLTIADLAFTQHGSSYPDLTPEQRGTLLDDVTKGLAGIDQANRLTAPQMKLWTSDLRAETVACFMSHPAVQCALGISSSMTGGDNVFQGFANVTPDSKEAFEPEAIVAEARV